MLFMPPGAAKSTYGSVRGPAYYLGRLPKNNVIMASYANDLATAFGRKVRNLVATREYHALFPDTLLAEDSKAKGEWETQQGGTYLAAGVGSGITGRRGDMGIIDDPIKGRKEADSKTIRDNTWDWYKSDFLTRLKPNAAQLIIQTRWHEDDLAGRILPEKWNGESGVIVSPDDEQEWLVICIQAEAGEQDPLGRAPGEYLWLDWFDAQYWKETKAAQAGKDIRNWTALYQQTPQPEEGTFFKREWFQRYPLGEHPSVTRYGAGDYAVTDDGGDYSEQGIGGFDRDENLWMLDWWSGQTESDVWVDELLRLATLHEVRAFVGEKGQIEKSVGPFLRKEMRLTQRYVRVESITHGNKDKAANARSFQALASQRKVFIPLCSWGDALIEQLISFPAGTHDDKVDACGLFGKILDQTYGPRNAPPPEEEQETDAWGREKPADDWKSQL